MTVDSDNAGDLHTELREVEGQIERLRAEAAEVVSQRKNSGALDTEDVASLLIAQEENDALLGTLEARRSGLLERLGQP